MRFPWALARFLPSAVRVRITSRLNSARPSSTVSFGGGRIKPVLTPRRYRLVRADPGISARQSTDHVGPDCVTQPASGRAGYRLDLDPDLKPGPPPLKHYEPPRAGRR